MSYSELQDMLHNRKQLFKEQRQVEADAFAVLRTRRAFFGLKLLLGINHKAPEPETGEPEQTETLVA